MSPTDPIYSQLAVPILLGQVQVLVGLGIVTALRLARDARVGRAFFSRHDSGGVKPSLLALATGLLLVAAVADPFPRTHAVFVLVGVMLLTVLSPGGGDEACGELGVYRGWHGRRYDELEEWRLTGEHLRFRLLGEWSAVRLPRQQQARVRQLLEREAAGRESPYRD